MLKNSNTPSLLLLFSTQFLLDICVHVMRGKGVITKRNDFDIKLNYPSQYYKKCPVTGKENLHPEILCTHVFSKHFRVFS